MARVKIVLWLRVFDLVNYVNPNAVKFDRILDFCARVSRIVERHKIKRLNINMFNHITDMMTIRDTTITLVIKGDAKAWATNQQ